ncbi:MAG: hypothetical protein SRB2_03671 [Desulfobacteraceae bacterium Eth-SRB2]|nr:MAG: hypothetical protein SRB2_03671 [Desulfobacteraceae bacterium Eth-SRB2]
MTDRPRIIFSFNLILCAYLCVDFLVSLLFNPKIDEKVPWDEFYNAFPVLSIIISFILGITLLLWGAKLFEAFWNRLISDIFKLREINFQEALALILVISIIAI